MFQTSNVLRKRRIFLLRSDIYSFVLVTSIVLIETCSNLYFAYQNEVLSIILVISTLQMSLIHMVLMIPAIPILQIFILET